MRSLRHSFASFVGALSRASNWLAAVIVLTAMMLMVSTDVILRYIFNSPLVGGREISGLMLMSIVFLSVAYCWTEDGHIRMTLIYGRLGFRGRSLLDVIATSTGLFFWGLLFFQSCIDISYAIRINEVGDESGLQLWPARLLLSFGLIIFCLELVVSLVKALIKIFHQDKEEER